MHAVPLFKLAGALAASAAAFGSLARAADKTIKIAINLPFTGSEAQDALLVKNGAVLAIEDINGRGSAGGYQLEPMLLDDGTTTIGDYDPAQAAMNARKMVADPAVLAAIGPLNSGSGKAMSPILSMASLAIVTASATNPDITDPKFAQEFRPKGPPVFFRTVTTDAYQGPNMANFYAEVLKLPSVFVLDDSGAYGVGLADAFEAQARKKGMKVMGRDRVDPKAADYSSIMTKLKSPRRRFAVFRRQPASRREGGQAVLRGGAAHRQRRRRRHLRVRNRHDRRLPRCGRLVRHHRRPAPARQSDAQSWVERYRKRWNMAPNDYSITAYDAASGDRGCDRPCGQLRCRADARGGAVGDPGYPDPDHAGTDQLRCQRRYRVQGG